MFVLAYLAVKKKEESKKSNLINLATSTRKGIYTFASELRVARLVENHGEDPRFREGIR